jgi:hypothetical protein
MKPQILLFLKHLAVCVELPWRYPHDA